MVAEVDGERDISGAFLRGKYIPVFLEVLQFSVFLFLFLLYMNTVNSERCNVKLTKGQSESRGTEIAISPHSQG